MACGALGVFSCSASLSKWGGSKKSRNWLVSPLFVPAYIARVCRLLPYILDLSAVQAPGQCTVTMSSISRLRGIDTEKKRHRLHERISVPLDVLEFPFSRPLDPAHVERLTAMFGGGRCLPQKDEYRIPAIVNRDALKEEWFEERAGTKYLNPPAEFRLPCLRGQHRVKAAQNLLSGEKRWVIDIYDSCTWLAAICEACANIQKQSVTMRE